MDTDHARELHRRAVVIDGHCDTLIPVTEGKMSLGDRVKVPDLDWQAPPDLEDSPLVKLGVGARTVWFGCMGQYDLPRLLTTRPRRLHVDLRIVVPIIVSATIIRLEPYCVC